jgi:hypothetical protein
MTHGLILSPHSFACSVLIELAMAVAVCNFSELNTLYIALMSRQMNSALLLSRRVKIDVKARVKTTHHSILKAHPSHLPQTLPTDHTYANPATTASA